MQFYTLSGNNVCMKIYKEDATIVSRRNVMLFPDNTKATFCNNHIEEKFWI